MNRFLLLYILCSFFFVNAQEKAETLIHQFNEKFPQEKISILFDKDDYIAGDQVFFQAFVFDGYSRSGISSTLFVELYDADKKIVSRHMFPIYKGEAKGSLKLSDTLKENVYFIRAYTAWMLNFAEDFNYIKPLVVYNPTSEEKVVKTSSSDFTITAYPESGTLLNGVDTKIAVRMHSDGPRTKDWKGIISTIQQPEKAVASFSAMDENVGLFNLTAEKGKTYLLTVTDGGGKRKTIPLPVASNEGISLQVTSKDNEILYSLRAAPEGKNQSSYKVIATINNRMVYKAVHKTINAQSYAIPTNLLINSVLQIAVLDENQKLVASRLCFVKPGSLDIKKPILEMVDLPTNAKSAAGFGIAPQANYSHYTILVQDAGQSSSAEECNLLSDLFLSGDLKSEMQSPAQYFSKSRNTEALDALLISEQWKRFDWNDIISQKLPFIKYQPSAFLSYTGSLQINQKPAPNTELTLVYKNENTDTKLIIAKTDNAGNFVMQNMNFEETFRFSYQINQGKAPQDYKVFVKPNFGFVAYQKALPKTGYALVKRSAEEPISKEISNYVAAKNLQKNIDSKITEIQEVKLKAQKKSKTDKLNDELSSPQFRTADEIVIDLVNDNNAVTSSPDLLRWLNGRVAGLEIRTEQGQSVPYIRGTRANIYLDEMRVDPAYLNAVSINDIAMIKVFKGISAAMSGSSVVLYTKRGTSANGSAAETPSKLKEIELTGYDKSIHFNNIDYSDNTTSKSVTDTRSVLYWSSNQTTENNTPLKVKFYNNDEAKRYQITIIALDDNNGTEPLFYSETLP